ncbi:hypothetical protein D3C72_2021430 [compost metagenome]
MGGDKAQNQHGHTNQTEQAGNQQGAIIGLLFTFIDVLQCPFVGVDQVASQYTESLAQWLVGGHAARGCGSLTKSLEVALIMAVGIGEVFTGSRIAFLVDCFVQQVLELRLQVSKGIAVGGFIEH